jgi:transposase
MFNNFIGIDVSKDSFNYCVIDSQLTTIEQGSFEMSTKGFENFKNIISKYQKSVIALESTGSYHINILSFIASFKKEVYLVNPILIKRFIQTISLRKTKTDEIDANLIAKFIFYHNTSLKQFVPNNMNEILALSRVRESITRDVAEMKTKLKQDVNTVFPELVKHYNIFTKTILGILKAFPTTQSIKEANESKIKKAVKEIKGKKVYSTIKDVQKLAKESISNNNGIFSKIIEHDVKTLEFLNQQLEEITKTLLEEIKKEKEISMDILTSIDGISDITAAHFIAEIKDIRNFENRNKLIAFAGTDPSIKESGTSLHQNGRITKKGSSSLRRTIYIMGMSLIRSNQVFREYYYKKRQEGFKHRKAMTALGNKLLRVIFSLLKKEEIWVKK